MELMISANEVMIDGEPVFMVPVVGQEIRVAGIASPPNSHSGELGHRHLFVGTDGCCSGNIYTLTRHGWKEKFGLTSTLGMDIGVRDIVPVVHRDGVIRFEDRPCLLAAGYSCNGRGVRLISPVAPTKPLEIVGNDEWNELVPSMSLVRPALRVGPTYPEGSVHLDIYGGDAWSGRWYREIYGTTDLTKRLEAHGIDVGQENPFWVVARR